MAERVGLYGKLPSKRDFIALRLPSGYLEAWEDWLQASVAASREQLGHRWLDLFLALPIWRYWLGPAVCGGRAVAGAFMPSVDGVGRYFPLCLCASAGTGPDIPPPAADPMPLWFETAESALLRVLDPEFASEPAALLDEVPDVPANPAASLEDQLTAMLRQELLAGLSGECWFWTLGGGDIMPMVLRYRGLPDPYQFVRFLGAGATQPAAAAGVR